MVAIVWGHYWSGKLIQFHCDNKAVVLTLNSLLCKDKGLLSLLRCMIFIAAKYSIWFSSAHIPGRFNTIADAISRNQMKMFFSQAPSAIDPSPINIPHTLPEVLYRAPPDWLSPASSIQEFYAAGLTDSTKATYRAGQKKYAQSCKEYQISQVLPATQELLCYFVSYEKGLAYSTIKRLLGCSPLVSLVMDG